MITKEKIAAEYKRVKRLAELGHPVDAVESLRNMLVQSLSDRELDVFGDLQKNGPTFAWAIAERVSLKVERVYNILRDLEGYCLASRTKNRKGDLWREEL